MCAKGNSESTDLAVSYLGLSWVASDSIKNHLLAWEGLFGRKVRKKKKAARVLTHVLFRSIWRERNRRAFEGVEILIQRLKDNFINMLHLWESGKFSSSPLEMVDLLDSLYIGCI